MLHEQQNHVHDLIDRSARCIAALLDVVGGQRMPSELPAAAADLVRELRYHLVEVRR